MDESGAPGPDHRAVASSASSLLRPCFDRIKQQITGRKYAKLQADIESLLEKLDVLLSSGQPVAARPPAPAPPPVAARTDAGVGVGLQEDPNGRIKLSFALPEDKAGPVDAGHMPSSPMAATERHPGALADGAARGEDPYCCACTTAAL